MGATAPRGRSGSRSTATAWLRPCSATDGHAGSTTTPRPPAPPPSAAASMGSARRSAVRSWSVGAYGASWPSRSTKPRPLPPETETRMAQFADLVATAVANAEARAEVERLADEQAALRRVATLVAEGASPTAVFDAVAAEMERLLDADRVALNRYEAGDEVTVVAHRGSEAARLPPGSRVSAEGGSVSSLVRDTERPARLERLRASATGAVAELARGPGLRGAVGAPIVVDGRLWGVITPTGTPRSRRQPTPRGGWRSSPSCWTPRSRTPTAATSSQPRGRVCSAPATKPAAASCATCTTERSSGWCTRS